MQPPAASEATVTTSARGLMTPLERERDKVPRWAPSMMGPRLRLVWWLSRVVCRLSKNTCNKARSGSVRRSRAEKGSCTHTRTDGRIAQPDDEPCPKIGVATSPRVDTSTTSALCHRLILLPAPCSSGTRCSTLSSSGPTRVATRTSCASPSGAATPTSRS